MVWTNKECPAMQDRYHRVTSSEQLCGNYKILRLEYFYQILRSGHQTDS